MVSATFEFEIEYSEKVIHTTRNTELSYTQKIAKIGIKILQNQRKCCILGLAKNK